MPRETRKIFFYDAECGLCSSFVRYIHRLDRAGQIYFAPIHGQTFSKVVPLRMVSIDERWESSYYFNGEAIWNGAEGILQLMISLGPVPRCLARLIHISIPTWMRERIYRIVAFRRRTILKKQNCPMPPLSLRVHMMD